MFGNLAAKQAARALRDAFFYLTMQVIAQVVPCHWSHFGLRAERISHLGGAHPLDEKLLELSAHLVDHNEPLGGDAALAGVHQASLGAHSGGKLEVRILQHEIGIATAQLEWQQCKQNHAPTPYLGDDAGCRWPGQGRQYALESAAPIRTWSRAE
jgi:hypothetical protein